MKTLLKRLLMNDSFFSFLVKTLLTVMVCLGIALGLDALSILPYGLLLFLESGVCFLIKFMTYDKSKVQVEFLIKKIPNKYQDDLYDSIHMNTQFLGMAGFVLLMLGYYERFI
ncbi:MAG TPA: hypothetical protein VLS94_03470 [Fusibacter sp.]|nr:hypothetical protein [Fusibacter sp.]